MEEYYQSMERFCKIDGAKYNGCHWQQEVMNTSGKSLLEMRTRNDGIISIIQYFPDNHGYIIFTQEQE